MHVYMGMGNLVNMAMCICTCVGVCICVLCVDMYMCMNMIVSCMSTYVHILHLYVLYDYVQRCEGTVSVELNYIN